MKKLKWYSNKRWSEAREFMQFCCFFVLMMCLGMILYWLSFIPFPPGTLGP